MISEKRNKSLDSQHEVIIPNEGLPCKLFLFEGGNGNYLREKHWHRSVEIFAVKKGNLTFQVNETEYLLQAGEFMLVNCNEVHSVYAPDPNVTVVLQIPLHAFSAYYTEDQFIWFSHSEKNCDRQIFDLVDEMYQWYEKKEIGHEFQILSLFYQVQYLLITRYRKQNVHEQLLKDNKQLNRLGEISDYLKEHYAEEISLEKLAGIFGYSTSYLSRMFMKYARINYKDYLQSVRLEHAMLDLEQPELKISEIALDHGFPNSKAFSNLFRRYYGILPNEYRKIKFEKDKKVT